MLRPDERDSEGHNIYSTLPACGGEPTTVKSHNAKDVGAMAATLVRALAASFALAVLFEDASADTWYGKVGICDVLSGRSDMGSQVR